MVYAGAVNISINSMVITNMRGKAYKLMAHPLRYFLLIIFFAFSAFYCVSELSEKLAGDGNKNNWPWCVSDIILVDYINSLDFNLSI